MELFNWIQRERLKPATQFQTGFRESIWNWLPGFKLDSERASETGYPVSNWIQRAEFRESIWQFQRASKLGWLQLRLGDWNRLLGFKLDSKRASATGYLVSNWIQRAEFRESKWQFQGCSCAWVIETGYLPSLLSVGAMFSCICSSVFAKSPTHYLLNLIHCQMSSVTLFIISQRNATSVPITCHQIIYYQPAWCLCRPHQDGEINSLSHLILFVDCRQTSFLFLSKL